MDGKDTIISIGLNVKVNLLWKARAKDGGAVAIIGVGNGMFAVCAGYGHSGKCPLKNAELLDQDQAALQAAPHGQGVW